MNGANSLTAGEVEVIQIIAARTNECGFCVAGHTKLATLKKLLSEQSIKAARALAAGEFDDAKLSALATFTQAVMAKKRRGIRRRAESILRCRLQPTASR